MSAPTTRPPDPPAEVRTAVWLWVGSIVVGIVAVVVAALHPDDAVRQLIRTQVEAQPLLRGTSEDALVRIVSVLGVVLSLVWAGVKLALVLLVRRGRGWARTVLLVLGALGVVSTLLGLREQTVPSAALALLGSVLVVAALVAVCSGDANPYLAPRPRTPPGTPPPPPPPPPPPYHG